MVSEGDPAAPMVPLVDEQLQIVRHGLALSKEPPLADPLLAVVLVSQLLERGNVTGCRFQTVDGDRNVHHGSSRHTVDRGTSDVFNRANRLADGFQQSHPFALVPVSPARVLPAQFDCSLAGSRDSDTLDLPWLEVDESPWYGTGPLDPKADGADSLSLLSKLFVDDFVGSEGDELPVGGGVAQFAQPLEDFGGRSGPADQ